MKYAVVMFCGSRRLMEVSYHRVKFDAQKAAINYALEDKDSGHGEYQYRVENFA